MLVGVVERTPNRVWRTLKNAFPSGANWFSKAGSLVGRTTSNQAGSIWLKL